MHVDIVVNDIILKLLLLTTVCFFCSAISVQIWLLPGRNPIQDPTGFSRILQDPVSSHRILPRILNGTVLFRILLRIL